jgi:hypothetical protein
MKAIVLSAVMVAASVGYVRPAVAQDIQPQPEPAVAWGEGAEVTQVQYYYRDRGRRGRFRRGYIRPAPYYYGSPWGYRAPVVVPPYYGPRYYPPPGYGWGGGPRYVPPPYGGWNVRPPGVGLYFGF